MNTEFNSGRLSSEILSIAFIANGINEVDVLPRGLKADRVVLLTDPTDGVGEITQILSTYQDLENIHILSHGHNSSVQLGNSFLNQASLSAYQNDLKLWGEALTSDGDLLFYGCNLAADADGLAFVEKISQLTQADVAASDDLTGNAALGGDWQLEVSVGEIATVSSIEDYSGL